MENYNPSLHLNKRDIVELLAFFFESGWISYEQYDYVHDFIWKLKTEMDILYPGWQPNDLRKFCKEIKRESRDE